MFPPQLYSYPMHIELWLRSWILSILLLSLWEASIISRNQAHPSEGNDWKTFVASYSGLQKSLVWIWIFESLLRIGSLRAIGPGLLTTWLSRTKVDKTKHNSFLSSPWDSFIFIVIFDEGLTTAQISILNFFNLRTLSALTMHRKR